MTLGNQILGSQRLEDALIEKKNPFYIGSEGHSISVP